MYDTVNNINIMYMSLYTIFYSAYLQFRRDALHETICFYTT